MTLPIQPLSPPPSPQVCCSAAWALTVASSDVPTAMEICRYKGLDTLQDLRESYGRQSKVNSKTDGQCSKIILLKSIVTKTTK